MDWFSFHPYLEKSSIPPTFAHPKVKVIAIADYGKLTSLLGRAFDGTAQRGSTLPILYDEFGVQTRATDGKRALYTNQGCRLRPTRSTRRRRPATTRSPSGSPPARRTSSGCSSSTSATRPTSGAGSRACTTRTTRRSRASRRCGRPPMQPAPERSSRAAPASILRVSEGQYVAYTYYRVDPAWRRLPVEERAAGKDAFAEVVESWAERMEGLRAYTCTGVRPGLRLLPLEDHRALRRPRRARRRAERDAARRLARDALLLPRDDEGVAVHERAQAAEARRTTSRTSSSTRS